MCVCVCVCVCVCACVCVCGWWVVIYVPSTAMSFGDGSPIYCALRRT